MSSVAALKVAEIVRDAGGTIIGRTKLQKIAYLLAAAGLENGLPFMYKHYGPYSEALAFAARDASLLGYVSEAEHVAAWGGTYSVYRVPGTLANIPAGPRQRLASEAARADAIVLELAATAVFLRKEEGIQDVWAETARRKPEKATAARVSDAKTLLRDLAAIQVPEPLPAVF
jgi:uncharacterized protein YwgA